MTLAQNFGYTADSWDMPGSATIELISFEGLGLGQAEAKLLGFTQEIWDCYVNHYLFFDWDELDPEIQGYLTGIGWDENNWGPAATKPDTYNQFWDELMDYMEAEEGNLLAICRYANVTNDVRGRLFELIVISRLVKKQILSNTDPHPARCYLKELTVV